MKPKIIVIVDKEPLSRKRLVVSLRARGYAVLEATDGTTAMITVRQSHPHLVIWDMTTSDVPATHFCKWVREGFNIPIITLSQQDDETLKVKLLDSGADDCVTKPIRMEELLARMRAVMRRALQASEERQPPIEIDDLTINLTTRRVQIHNREIHLTQTEFSLLAALSASVDKILSHDELLSRVWGSEFRGSNQYLHVYMGRLRKKIGEPYSDLLRNVPAFGYVLQSTLHA